MFLALGVQGINHWSAEVGLVKCIFLYQLTKLLEWKALVLCVD